MPKIDLALLSDCVVLNESEKQVPLAALWANQPAVLVFLRHFGCIECRSHAKQVWQERDQYEKLGAKISFIGSGQSHYIEGFKAEFNLENAPIYTDPSLRSFAAAGLIQSMSSTVGPKALFKFATLTAQGHRQKGYRPSMGSLTQQGGTLIVCQKSNGAQLLYSFASKQLGDLPGPDDVKEMLSALKSYTRT